MRAPISFVTALILLLTASLGGCCMWPKVRDAGEPVAVPEAEAEATPAEPAPPTVADAQAFMDEFEAERRRLMAERERADWVRSNFISHDTELVLAKAEEKLMAFMTRSVDASRQFAGLALEGDLARKMKLLLLTQNVPAPADPGRRERLATVLTNMQSHYGKARYCPEGGECKGLGDLMRVIGQSREPAALLDAWRGWRTTSVANRARFDEYVALVNEGARELGFAHAGALWQSKYDMPPGDFAVEADRLWSQVAPLYEQLHCYVRGRLAEHYGAEAVPAGEPIPAHLLGNMWSQSWGGIADVVVPDELRQGDGSSPVTKALVDKGIDAVAMTKMAEDFFVSVGLPRLPETFWERSLFTKPADRDVVCHASAWPVDWYDDLRIKMCIEQTEDDLVTIHHELGHLYYYDAYKDLSMLYTESAHDGFHEALGDVIALSVTPSYLQNVGLLEGVDDWPAIEVLLRTALDKVAFLPFGLLVDSWRWRVFSGEFPPERYNASWWELRTKYQGIAPPVARSEADFDPAAKYHISASVPYMRYFLAHLLQFQLHRALCKVAGHTGPLHECSIQGSTEAGARLQAMMAMGMSRPWPDALEAVTGERQMDGTALLEYFAPLYGWLEAKNQKAGWACGW